MQTSAARAASAAAASRDRSGSWTGQPGSWAIVGAGQLRAQGVEERRHLDAEPEVLVARHDAVVGERVATEEGERVVGARPDEREGPVALERQRAVVVEQHHRRLGELARDRAVGGRVEVERARGHGGRLR